MIHPTAIVDPKAKLHKTASVGAYSIIDGDVAVGADCVIGPHVYLTGKTTIGLKNIFHAGCVIGDAPQDLKYKDEVTELKIGDNNVFREQVTIHRSTTPSDATIIGANNYLMVNCHVGHNCTIGNHVIMANGALLGGHVTVNDRAFISGNCLLHQFVRVGTVALMQGGSAISKDLPPYTIARGDNGICGLNVLGLRRAGFNAEQRAEVKRLYRLLFRTGLKMHAAIAEARRKFSSPAALVMLDFVSTAKRGICMDVGSKFHEESEAE
jgi:UDP-N-acetylglucosamine acyltransferase